jgi:hypothetical protein
VRVSVEGEELTMVDGPVWPLWGVVGSSPAVAVGAASGARSASLVFPMIKN